MSAGRDLLSAGAAAAEARKITRELDALARVTVRLGARRRVLIRSLVTGYGWSQREVAAELGISRPRLSQIINKKEGRPGG